MHDTWKNSAADPRFQILQPQPRTPLPPVDGIAVWRGMRESETSAFAGEVFDEFPSGAADPPDEPTRRHFLQIMGASLALSGAAGCDVNQPPEAIVPYVRAPEYMVQGIPLYYATAMTCGEASLGLLVKTHMGRPTKVEGNPLHPAVPQVMPQAFQGAPPDRMRFGATDAFAQGTVLSLYDPDRSQTVLRRGQIDTWDACYTDLRRQLERLAPTGGEGLRLLTEPIVSPTLADQVQQLLSKFPNARWHQYVPLNDENATLGARLALGEDVSITYLGRPEVVLSLDADCFADGPMRLQLARNFRWLDLQPGQPSMGRLYVVETSATTTGAAADHRLGLSPRGVVAFALAVARELALEVAAGPESDEFSADWVRAVVEDLTAARGRSVVVAGRGQPPVVHAIAHWLNETLGNVGNTVQYRAPLAARQEIAVESIRELASAMQAGKVQALVMVGGNPTFDAPADLKFAELLEQVPFTLHLSQYADETSARCLWHVPELHLFEAWSDTRAGDGTVSIVQPLIAPLHGGKSPHELVAAMLGNLTASGYDLVRRYWQNALGMGEGSEFERVWQTALHDGVVGGTQLQPVSPKIDGEFTARLAEHLNSRSNRPAAGDPQSGEGAEPLQLIFRPDPSVWDGRFANNGWLQELPRPLTKLTWDNALLMSPDTAARLRIKTGDVVEIETSGGRVAIPVFVLVRHPRQTLTVHVGYGRRRVGRVGNKVGTDVYPLRTSDAMWSTPVMSLRKTGRTQILAATQHHHRLAGRGLVRVGTLEQFQKDPDHPPFLTDEHHHEEPLYSLYPEPEYFGNKWGMVINQSACIGCNACVIACQAENNIPVVGKEQVWRGREMHWLRIDSYYGEDREPGRKAHEGNTSSAAAPGLQSPAPPVYHQPMLCQHCEYAPCEPVCPVAATSHSDEGINEMTYNRCIGTRYCSNNCPYKVRRFNFYNYNEELRSIPLLHLLPNPDVTVRERGVMEKCTYCVQRINAARIEAKKEHRPIRDGEVLTACQAACATQAIVFGNLNDPNSEVRRFADSSLNYSVLGELNTRPRTTYLAVLRNPRSMGGDEGVQTADADSHRVGATQGRPGDA